MLPIIDPSCLQILPVHIQFAGVSDKRRLCNVVPTLRGLESKGAMSYIQKGWANVNHCRLSHPTGWPDSDIETSIVGPNESSLAKAVDLFHLQNSAFGTFQIMALMTCCRVPTFKLFSVAALLGFRLRLVLPLRLV